MFFDENWNTKSETVSFGHDIEASWLLPEAAEVSGDETLIRQWKDTSAKIAEASLQGLDENGGLNYEREKASLNKEKHWWVQAEAMVGFLNAFQITGDPDYYDRFVKCWGFIKRFLSDRQRGEWLWGINEDLSVMPGQDKVGMWKCPYHNGRACLEIIRRLS
ncbi:Cellobiose 2-epimerase [compost metagenome]